MKRSSFKNGINSYEKIVGKKIKLALKKDTVILAKHFR